MEYKSNSNVVYSCKYHVVWCPKYRRKVLVDGVDVRLKSLVQEVCAERDFSLIEIEVMPDHVHLLIEVDPQFGIHRAVKLIKGQHPVYYARSFLGCGPAFLPCGQTHTLFRLLVVRHCPLSKSILRTRRLFSGGDTMEYSYKFRLYPTKMQEQQIHRTFGCCRYLWNHYLAQRKAVYELDGHTMNYYECSKI